MPRLTSNFGRLVLRPRDVRDYQRLLAMVRAGEIAGITAYDGSRLNRDTENALASE